MKPIQVLLPLAGQRNKRRGHLAPNWMKKFYTIGRCESGAEIENRGKGRVRSEEAELLHDEKDYRKTVTSSVGKGKHPKPKTIVSDWKRLLARKVESRPLRKEEKKASYSVAPSYKIILTQQRPSEQNSG